MMMFFGIKSTLDALAELSEHRPRHRRHRSPYLCMQPGSIRWAPEDEDPHMPWTVIRNTRPASRNVHYSAHGHHNNNNRLPDTTNDRWPNEDRFQAFERRMEDSMAHLVDRMWQMEQGHYRQMDDHHR